MTPERIKQKGFFFAFLTILIWGSAPVLEKIALTSNVSPITGVFIRTLATVIVATVIMFGTKQMKVLKKLDKLTLVYIILGGLSAGMIGQITFYSALKYGVTSKVVTIAGAYPLVTLTVSVLFLKEKITRKKFIGIIMIVSGVMLLA